MRNTSICVICGWLSLLGCGASRYLADLVLGFCHAHDPLIKPTNDVLQTLDTMPWLTGTRQLVRLVWKTNHHRRYLPVLQCAKHRLAAWTSRSAIVSLSKDQ